MGLLECNEHKRVKSHNSGDLKRAVIVPVLKGGWMINNDTATPTGCIT